MLAMHKVKQNKNQIGRSWDIVDFIFPTTK